MELNVDQVRLDSKIYPNIEPGCFLYNYHKSLNDAAFEFALANPILLNNKGELQLKAKMKVEADGYQFAKKRSRSNAGQKRCKETPNVRQKKITEIQEDLDELNVELQLLQRSRDKARNVNCNDNFFLMMIG